jgi:imidazolonepropionase-like amidohydrolase
MKRFFVLLVFLLAACAHIPDGVPLEPIEPSRLIIFHNGVILTMTPDQPVVEAIAIRGEKIKALGSNEETLGLKAADTTLIDLSGHILMPGFIDAHTHILNDARSKEISLDEAQYLALSNGICTLGDLYVDEAFLREI